MTYCRLLNDESMTISNLYPSTDYSEDIELEPDDLIDPEMEDKIKKLNVPKKIAQINETEQTVKKEDPYAWDKIMAMWFITAILLLIFMFVIV